MSSYNTFARFYDELTGNVEYQKRSEYIEQFFESSDRTVKTILDLACGTCSVSLPLAEKGYRVIGVDASENMLEIASEKLVQSECDFTLLKADMRNFDLVEQVDAAVCSLDSINHLNSITDVKRCFDSVYAALKNGSLFVFDVNTVYKHNEILSDNTFVFDEDDYYLVWDNEQLDNRSVRVLIDVFIYNGKSYDRESEEFTETAYTVDELKNILKKSGFSSVCFYDELTLDEPKNDSQRLYFVCKKD